MLHWFKWEKSKGKQKNKTAHNRSIKEVLTFLSVEK